MGIQTAAEKSNLQAAAQDAKIADVTGVDTCPACDSPEIRPLFTAKDVFNRQRETAQNPASHHQAEPAETGPAEIPPPTAYQIVECGKCRLVRLHPQPVPLELQAFYPANYWLEPDHPHAPPFEAGVRRFLLRDRIRFMECALHQSFETALESAEDTAQNHWLIDVGCGGGLTLQLLQERGWKNLIGLEFGVDSAASILRSRAVPAVCGTFSRAPFKLEHCALITMFHVLEHLYDPASYLDAAHRALAPHGRLIVQIRNAASWQFLLFGERWAGLNTPRHLVQFRRKDVESLLQDCGFEILRERHFSWSESAATCASSLLPALDPSVRRLRGKQESPAQSAFKDVGFFALSALCLPFVLLEAACRAGAVLTIEARKKTLENTPGTK